MFRCVTEYGFAGPTMSSTTLHWRFTIERADGLEVRNLVAPRSGVMSTQHLT